MEKNYEKCGILELRQIAKRCGIKYSAHYRKPQLIQKIKEAESQQMCLIKQTVNSCKKCKVLAYCQEKLNEMLKEIDYFISKN